MRESAATIKGRVARPKVRPDPESAVGTVYDILRAYPATPLSSEWVGRGSAMIDYLRDYGLDVRSYSRGWWWLVGEWDGSHYIDHIAARVPR